MIIALTGLAGSGKDTAAIELASIMGNATIVALADLPKEMAAEHFNIPMDWFYDRDIKDTPLESTGLSPRNMMVQWFDKLFKEHGDDYSLQMNIKKINAILEEEKHVIISDIRYPIEFDWIDKEGITLLNIQRDGIDKTIDHISEAGSVHGIKVNNNGTIKEMNVLLSRLYKLLNNF